MRNALYWHFLPYSVSPFWIAYSSVYILNKCILKGWGPEIFRFQSLLDIGVTASTLSIEHFQPIHPKSERLQITIFLDQQIQVHFVLEILLLLLELFKLSYVSLYKLLHSLLFKLQGIIMKMYYRQIQFVFNNFKPTQIYFANLKPMDIAW